LFVLLYFIILAQHSKPSAKKNIVNNFVFNIFIFLFSYIKPQRSFKKKNTHTLQIVICYALYKNKKIHKTHTHAYKNTHNMMLPVNDTSFQNENKKHIYKTHTPNT